MKRKIELAAMDNKLAEFADKVLDGESPRSNGLTDELADLEETILRLNLAVSREAITETRSKRMLARLKEQMKRKEEKTSFWSRFATPQVGFLVVAAAVALFLVINDPLVIDSALSGTATSSKGGVYIAAGAFIILLALAALFMRKK